MGDYITILYGELLSLVKKTEGFSYEHTAEIVIISSIVISLVFFILAWGVYEGTDKTNIGNFVKFDFKSLFKQVLCGLILTSLLLVFDIISLNIYSIAVSTIFWRPLFIKIMKIAEKSSSELLNEYGK
jgi:hypothetical protein